MTVPHRGETPAAKCAIQLQRRGETRPCRRRKDGAPANAKAAPRAVPLSKAKAAGRKDGGLKASATQGIYIAAFNPLVTPSPRSG